PFLTLIAVPLRGPPLLRPSGWRAHDQSGCSVPDRASEWDKDDLITPLVHFAGRHHRFQVVENPAQSRLSIYDKETRHWLTSRDARAGESNHGIPVMGQHDTASRSGPGQDVRVRGVHQTDILHTYEIQTWHTG